MYALLLLTENNVEGINGNCPTTWCFRHNEQKFVFLYLYSIKILGKVIGLRCFELLSCTIDVPHELHSPNKVVSVRLFLELLILFRRFVMRSKGMAVRFRMDLTEVPKSIEQSYH